MKTTEGKHLHALMATQMTLVLVFVALTALPAANPFKSARDFCEPVRTLAEQGQEFDLYSAGFSREEYVYYAHHFHTPVFTDLIEVEGVLHDLPPEKIARYQKKALDLMQDALEDIPVRDLGASTLEERLALQTALEKAVEESDNKLTAIEDYEIALSNKVDAYLKTFTSDTPAFMFVQEKDWRWMLALQKTPTPLTVLKHTEVGSRTVLLLTNEAGATLGL